MKSQPAFSKSYFLLWGVSVLTEWYLISFLWGTEGDVSTGTRDSWLSVGRWLSVLARLRKLCWGTITDCSRAESSRLLERSPSDPLLLTELSAGSAGSLSFSFSHAGGSYKCKKWGYQSLGLELIIKAAVPCYYSHPTETCFKLAQRKHLWCFMTLLPTILVNKPQRKRIFENNCILEYTGTQKGAEQMTQVWVTVTVI